MIKILFTSTGRRVELVQAFRSASEKTGIPLEIVGADMDMTAPALSFCDRAVQVPRIRDKAYIPSLLEYCRMGNIDALVPTIATDLRILADSREAFTDAGTRAVISRPEMIRICRDKRLTADYFRSVGLSSPQPVDDICLYQGGFPAFIKPKDGSSSISAYKVNSGEELKLYAGTVPDYIVQPFVSGREYTVDVFCDFEGSPVYITPRIRLAVRAGEVLKTEIRQDERIIEEVRGLLEDFRPCGPVTIQLIRDDETGKDHYIEINPRFGGGAPLSMKAGADSAAAMLRLLNGETLSYMPDAAEDGAVYSRFDQSVRVR